MALRTKILLLCLLMGGNGLWAIAAAQQHLKAQTPSTHLEQASSDVQQLANWVIDTGDNNHMPFMVVDKNNATVFLFEATGQLLGETAALLGLAVGDDSVAGIGKRKLSSILPTERTTPAGRFDASLGRNLQGKQILWVDYDSALSLHPVITSNLKERRGQRLATPTPLDNRISFGCINVPAEFFKHMVNPAFTQSSGVVYILPEIHSLSAVFPGFQSTTAHEKNLMPLHDRQK